MMMKKLIFLSIILISFSACEKRETKRVEYIATDAVSAYKIAYQNEAGVVVSETVEANSGTDKWKYAFMAEQGDIVYASGNYKDIGSALKVMVLIDGKVYKQAATRGDTVRYVTVSGVVPY
jgi:hypothetical protein